ncbi:MAG TPA: GcrA family cell cycle regulator [Hyphomicrobiaceae bacterium]
MSWNDERVEALKKLWADGLSASQIAGRLGGVTRNAVIGKVHRLGLAGRATTSRMKPHRMRVRTAQGAKRAMLRARPTGLPNSPLKSLYLSDEPYVPPAEELVIPLNERKYIQTLTESCCRWPIGDPQQPEFHFCGRKKIPGLPYCEVHARRAFQPPQARRRERDFVPMVALPKAMPAASAHDAPGHPSGHPSAQPSEKAEV